MNRKAVIATLFVLTICCVRVRPDWYDHQDRSIKMPPFDGTTKIDSVLDGTTLQALRVAADDFAAPSSMTRPCAQAQAAQTYEVSRSGDIIFIRVSGDPKACGGQGYALDGAARYAISKDGRILRRAFDGDGTDAWPDDAGTIIATYPAPDAGESLPDSSACPLGPYAPTWMFDAGSICGSEDAGMESEDAGTH